MLINEQQASPVLETIPTKVKLAWLLLKLSSWAVLVAGVTVISLNAVGLFLPINLLTYNALVYGTAFLIGLPLGIHEFRNTITQAKNLLIQQKAVNSEMNVIAPPSTNSNMNQNQNQNQNIVIPQKLFTQFSANQVFVGTAVATGSLLLTMGSEIKAYIMPTTTLSNSTLTAILVPGLGFTLLLAYGYRKSDIIVTTWENGIIDNIERANAVIKEILTTRNSIFSNDIQNKAANEIEIRLSDLQDSNNENSPLLKDINNNLNI